MKQLFEIETFSFSFIVALAQNIYKMTDFWMTWVRTNEQTNKTNNRIKKSRKKITKTAHIYWRVHRYHMLPIKRILLFFLSLTLFLSLPISLACFRPRRWNIYVYKNPRTNFARQNINYLLFDSFDSRHLRHRVFILWFLFCVICVNPRSEK